MMTEFSFVGGVSLNLPAVGTYLAYFITSMLLEHHCLC